MDDLTGYKARIKHGIHEADAFLLRVGRRQIQHFSEYRYFIAVMLLGFVIWVVVFNIALTDYLNTNSWKSRSAWLGPFPDPAEFDIFGYTILYQLEGYSDYSYYYVHWGHNLLNGVMPYSEDFGYIFMDGITNKNGIYMFPPLTAYLYGVGIWLETIIGPGNWGIGLLLASFGYLTAIPVYGIAKELSKNPRVGELAALTYLLNPLVLYHIDYIWLNPSAFYFFFFAGFYALVKKRKHIGTILIVTAALFKQTAWFLGIPLVIHLLMRARERKEPIPEINQPEETIETGEKTFPDVSALTEDTPLTDATTITEHPTPNRLQFLLEYFDFRGFLVSVIVAVSYAAAIMFPIIIAQPHFWDYWRVAMGHFSFNGNFTDLPAYGLPQSLPVLAILFEKPDLAESLESLLVSGGPLIFGVLIFSGIMLLLNKYDGEENLYLRRVLFLTLLLMLWVNLTGPRGVFKYYFTMFAPFFSIFSSARMIRGSGDEVPVSLSMFLAPFAFTLLILIPDRNIYLLSVIVIFLIYLLMPIIDRLYDLVKRPIRYLKRIAENRVEFRFETISLRYAQHQSRLLKTLEYTTVVTSIITGVSLVVFGFTITFSYIRTAIPVILQYFILTGVMLFLGIQLLSISTNGLLPLKERRNDLNYLLKTLSYSITTVLFGYGIFTYLSSWNVDTFYERQIMVLSSTILVIWIFSLIIRLKIHLRLLVTCFLLLATGLTLWVWLVLESSIMILFGLTSLAGLVVYLLLIMLNFVTSWRDVTDNSGQDALIAQMSTEQSN
ncbi:hypothetical protein EU527_00490 [Candidatus Thorarchaeota archaeon]|nr:MAG: hypothetical protein EU527_00490 [Candidatus Thorarchaeota archaeon]